MLREDGITYQVVSFAVRGAHFLHRNDPGPRLFLAFCMLLSPMAYLDAGLVFGVDAGVILVWIWSWGASLLGSITLQVLPLSFGVE